MGARDSSGLKGHGVTETEFKQHWRIKQLGERKKEKVMSYNNYPG